MDLIKIMKHQHKSFIKFIYASVMVKEADVAKKFEDIAIFKYRHMLWCMADLVEKEIEFDMNFDEQEVKKIKVDTEEALLEVLQEDLDTNLGLYAGIDNPTVNRLRSDDEYFINELNNLDIEGEISAFNEHKELPGVELEDDAKAALVFFLMEETFKEYELITIYSYLKVHSDIAIANSAFMDLAYDSIYHLKRFAELASKMGVLTLPRVIPENKYKDIGIVQFLKENIEEEMDAEKQCLILAEKIGNKKLSDFLLFISRQELYHAELLKRALEAIEK
ncbi:MAG: 4-hydroxythreonine-4-phosphate dehydrogenase [Epsilonproteobacteria bacterium]|nr:4-hydroxythreonine-4-phosphate dehydrogenase [Campylobacterota bacterium]